jgi:hypothetical protein
MAPDRLAIYAILVVNMETECTKPPAVLDVVEPDVKTVIFFHVIPPSTVLAAKLLAPKIIALFSSICDIE